MEEPRKAESARERLLDSATRLLTAKGVDVSTRAICDDAGVTAPTLYHHFGDREGLLQEVVTRGFGEYLDAKRARESTGDPVTDLLRGWDDHHDWGVTHPSFYALMYGQVKPGHRAPATQEAEQLLLEKLTAAARAGRLLISPDLAAPMVTSANVGSTLYAISRPDASQGLSARVRDATFASILTGDGGGESSVGTAAVALKNALAAEGGESTLPPAELHLLDDWLDRLAR